MAKEAGKRAVCHNRIVDCKKALTSARPHVYNSNAVLAFNGSHSTADKHGKVKRMIEKLYRRAYASARFQFWFAVALGVLSYMHSQTLIDSGGSVVKMIALIGLAVNVVLIRHAWRVVRTSAALAEAAYELHGGPDER